MKVQLNKVKQAGFSLVELLVVIAVIGIMAAIAIPMISNINANATLAKNKRNAQQIASTYGAAKAAGATTTALSETDEDAAVTALAAGTVTGTGQFENTVFRVPLAAPETTAAQTYLTLANGVMVYTP